MEKYLEAKDRERERESERWTEIHFFSLWTISKGLIFILGKSFENRFQLVSIRMLSSKTEPFKRNDMEFISSEKIDLWKRDEII